MATVCHDSFRLLDFCCTEGTCGSWLYSIRGSANCSQLVWCAGDCLMESFMICTAPHYYASGLMKEGEMEMSIWEIWG